MSIEWENVDIHQLYLEGALRSCVQALAQKVSFNFKYRFGFTHFFHFAE